MLQVDLIKIKKFFDSNLRTVEIAEFAGLAYTTTDTLRKGKTNLENASYRTLVKLTNGYEIWQENVKPKVINKEDKIELVRAAIGINKIDGIALSDEYIENFYKYANGEISSSEFDEYLYHKHSRVLID